MNFVVQISSFRIINIFILLCPFQYVLISKWGERENNVNVYTIIIIALILFISLGIIFKNLHLLLWDKLKMHASIKNQCAPRLPWERRYCREKSQGTPDDWKGGTASYAVTCSIRTSQDFCSHNIL